jgi:hypothetical protein
VLGAKVLPRNFPDCPCVYPAGLQEFGMEKLDEDASVISASKVTGTNVYNIRR